MLNLACTLAIFNIMHSLTDTGSASSIAGRRFFEATATTQLEQKDTDRATGRPLRRSVGTAEADRQFENRQLSRVTRS